jgi:hypothetical protein
MGTVENVKSVRSRRKGREADASVSGVEVQRREDAVAGHVYCHKWFPGTSFIRHGMLILVITDYH